MAFAWEGLALAQPASTVWVGSGYCASCPNDGHTWGYDAFSGIQAGIDHASLPGTVRVAAGTYAEKLNMRNGVAVLGAGSGVTFIDGGGLGTVVTFMHLDQETVIEGFTIQNGRSPGAGAGVAILSSTAVIRNNRIRNCQGWGIENLPNAPVTIQQNDVELNDGGIYTNGSMTAITGNRIRQNRGHGIQFINTNAFTIANNLIVENDGDGIDCLIPDFPNNPDEMRILNNTIAGNKGAGIYANRDPSLKLLNNILAGNGNCGVAFNGGYDWGKPTANHNDVWNNTGGNYCGPAETGPDDLSADPIFRDPPGGDYHIWPFSPCVDGGTASDFPATDFEGDIRPADGNRDGIAAVDIGADETGILFDHDAMTYSTLPDPIYLQSGAAFVPGVKVLNIGTQAESNVAVSCEISRGNEPVFTDQKTLPQLAGTASAELLFSQWIPHEPGEYRLKFASLLAADENSLNDTQVRIVQVVSLKAAFGFGLREGYLLDVQFTDQSTGDVAQWHWDFGDNTASSDRNPTHAYAEPGAYAVKLTVSKGGAADSQTQTVILLDIFGMSLGNRWTARTTGPGTPSISEQEIVTVPQETYDATGTWSYSLSSGWLDPGSSPGCTAIPSQWETADVTQLGKIVTVSIDGAPHAGSVSGTAYSASVSYPLLGGTATERLDFQLGSATAGSGSFQWEWGDGQLWCKGGNSLAMTRPDTQTGLPASNLFIQEERRAGVVKGYSWYERAGGQLKLWGLQAPEEGRTYNLRFSNGLMVAWYPMAVGDHRESSAAIVGSTGVMVSMAVDVLAQEEISLSFGPVRAYKLRYVFRTWGNGTDVTKTSYQWMAPYLGAIKFEGDSSVDELTSFAIGGGAIDLESDADGDGLEDYRELSVYGTNWQIGDTDGDGCGDGAEARGKRNPNAADPQGDLNGDCALDAKDAILGLQALSASQTPSITPAGGRDVNGDGRIGLADVVYILQKAAGLRSY